MRLGHDANGIASDYPSRLAFVLCRTRQPRSAESAALAKVIDELSHASRYRRPTACRLPSSAGIALQGSGGREEFLYNFKGGFAAGPAGGRCAAVLGSHKSAFANQRVIAADCSRLVPRNLAGARSVIEAVADSLTGRCSQPPVTPEVASSGPVCTAH